MSFSPVRCRWLHIALLTVGLTGAAIAADDKPKTQPNPAYAAAKQDVSSATQRVKQAAGFVQAATKKYSDARDRSRDMDLAAAKLLKELRDKADQDPRQIAAQKHYDDISNQIDQLRDKIIASLKEDAAYQQAVADKQAADARIAEYKEQAAGTVKPDDMRNEADRSLAAGTLIQKIINDKVATDPQSTELQEQLKNAQQQLIQLNTAAEAAIRADKEWLKLAKQVDSANDFMTDAKSALQSATADLRQASDQLEAARTVLAKTPKVIYPPTPPAKKK